MNNIGGGFSAATTLLKEQFCTELFAYWKLFAYFLSFFKVTVMYLRLRDIIPTDVYPYGSR